MDKVFSVSVTAKVAITYEIEAASKKEAIEEAKAMLENGDASGDVLCQEILGCEATVEHNPL